MAVIGKPDPSDRKDFSIPAGRYALIPTETERKQAKGKDTYYIRTKYIVVGPRRAANKWFRDTTSLDLSKNGACVRWQIWLGAIDRLTVPGTDDPVIGTPPEMSWEQLDRNIEDLVLGRGFVADVVRVDSGQYVNNGIEKIYGPGQWSEQERDAIEKSEAAFEDKRAFAAARAAEMEDDDIPVAGADELDPEDGAPIAGADELTLEDDDGGMPRW
jgi:hypothetical protein